MKKTKIICTVGPACESEDSLMKMVEAGMNVARLNFSHGDYEEHGKRIETIKRISKLSGQPLAILLDTRGPEIRTGEFKEKEEYLREGQSYTLTVRKVMGDNTICGITYRGLPNDVKVGDTILIDDGLVELKVVDLLNGEDIKCLVKNSGVIGDHKGINVPGVYTRMSTLTKKDRDDIEYGIKSDIDFIAASFVRNIEDVSAIRKMLEDRGAEHIKIIAKIENAEGIKNIDEIINVSDGVMIARGDLGVEIPTEELPLLQKKIIRKCNERGKPVITATQMLDSMIRNPRPTRAEVTDVANAILDGTDAIMLSGETAMGKYPVEAVSTMSQIAARTEESMDERSRLLMDHNNQEKIAVTDAISLATCNIAMNLEASAILTGTTTGHTARMVSKFRPHQFIIATTTDPKVQRQLCMSWGVYPILLDSVGSTDELIDKTVSKAMEYGQISKGDLVVITAGIPVGVGGTTNMIMAHVAS